VLKNIETVLAAPDSVIAGLQPAQKTAEQLGVSDRTLLRYEDFLGLPVIKIGRQRFHVPASVTAWLIAQERGHNSPRRGRPPSKLK
jgi:hypothetical protein